MVSLCYIGEAATTATHQDEGVSIASDPEPCGLPVPDPSGVLSPPLAMSLLPVFSIPDIPLDGTPWLGHSFAGLTILPKGNLDHSPSDSPDHLYMNRNSVTSPEVKVRSKHSSIWGDDHTPNPTPETRTVSRQPQ